MIAVLRMPQAIYAMQIFASAFLAILFLQSGIDKVVDRRGNFEWLKGHFAKSPLAGIVPALLICITILELAAGALSARRLRADNSFERFDSRVLRGNSFRGSHHGVVFWAADRQGLCRRGSACSLLSAHTGRNLSAGAGVTQRDANAISQSVVCYAFSNSQRLVNSFNSGFF